MAEESRLQTSILHDLESRKDCTCFKIMKCNEDGVPDIFFTTITSGPIFVEVKARGGVVSPKQKSMHDKLNKNGCPTFIVYTWQDWVKLKINLLLL